MSQDAVIAFLGNPATHGGAAVERIDTHISILFLVGDTVYKLKRAVTLPFLDFSTLSQRERACHAELTVNRRTAPDMYRAVLPITTGDDGRLAFDGTGDVVDWVVVMHRFDGRTLFDRLAHDGKLTDTQAWQLADAVARLHAMAAVRPDAGGVQGIVHTIDTNQACFEQGTGQPFDPTVTERLTVLSRTWATRLSGVLETRRHDGHVRQCHGDLHLGNICLSNGQATLFDAIEFNDDFADIDCFYDLAFLLMDLQAKELPRLASLVFNRYLERTGDFGALAALPLFLSLRAAIRSHVSATMAQGKASHREALWSSAQAYLEQAIAYLTPAAPRLFASGGLSGSGKSRLARELAPLIGPAPGALVLRSDVLRKRLLGVPLESRLPVDAYTEAVTEQTYNLLYAQAESALRAGHSVIADAVFARTEQRTALAAVAERVGVPFQGVWLDTGATVLRERVRNRTGDASDATPAVVDRQLSYDVGTIDWLKIDSSGSKDVTLADARRQLGL